MPYNIYVIRFSIQLRNVNFVMQLINIIANTIEYISMFLFEI